VGHGHLDEAFPDLATRLAEVVRRTRSHLEQVRRSHQMAHAVEGLVAGSRPEDLEYEPAFLAGQPVALEEAQDLDRLEQSRQP